MITRLLDQSILFSFDRSGFYRHKKRFHREDYSFNKGKIALVTGSNSGLGYAAAQAFAENGLTVYLMCRSQKRGEAAVKKLQKETANPNIHLIVNDISRIEETKACVDRLEVDHFDIVVNNAGVMPQHKILTPEGNELTFATHVLGHAALIEKLIEKNLLPENSRVIFVSSGGMYMQKIELSDLKYEQSKYNKYTAYANAKRAQVILTELLAEKYPAITFSCMHPGWAATPGVRHSMSLFYYLLYPLLRTPQEGADTIVWLALTSQNYPSGLFWFDRQSSVTHRMQQTKESDIERNALWDLCLT